MSLPETVWKLREGCILQSEERAGGGEKTLSLTLGATKYVQSVPSSYFPDSLSTHYGA